ncbi:phage tail tape measure protein [Vibrio navarrensis]|uniref:phage tail tape measure protein n=1 Tax=Vibrio navarrensis TaxID=29495 RepID=UPI00186A8D45|nr:phage tail tape measure protein [Vibrio navarrensis]MBE4578346.1 phage tail tape measure protein [Vibrio navarrensis]MBE4594847.1 phage tail tape measure protein [Vibrio navarrensis]
MLPEALRFTVGLVDQISAPLGKIQRQLNDVTNTYRKGTHTMMAGAAGMVGAGYTLQQALMPAIEMDRALGEVKALGVADDALKEIAKTALKFSAEFGQSAVEVVRHAEGIKNAMGDMAPDIMASVTRSSAILATAMKSDAATVNRYLKNLHGNYQLQANAMGKDNWTQQIVGITATAKQLFGFEMDAIEGMVDGMHSLTSTMGVSLQEQLAVFGMLKGQMSEGDAVTQYTNFLENAVSAQKKLGVQLTDTYGQLLPMQQVLENLRPLLDGLSGTQARTILDEAGLGDGALMLINLIDRADMFAESMDALNQVKGIDAATRMAADMTDQWQRMEQGIFAIRTAFGAALLPSLLPVVSSLADGAMEIIRWTEFLPNITRYVGYAAMAVLGLVAAGGLLTVVAGAFSILMSPITLIVTGIGLAIGAVIGLIVYWDKVKAAFGDMAMFKALENGVGMLRSSFGFLYQAIEPLFPLFKWIGSAIFEVLKVLAVVGIGVISNLITGGIQFVSYVLTAIVSGISLVVGAFSTLFQFLAAGWQWVMSGFTDTSGFAFIGQMADNLRNVFSSVFNLIYERLNGIWETVKSLTDWIPGFGNDDELELKSKSIQSATPTLQVQPGGAAKSIANYQTSSTNYGGVAIYPTYMNNVSDFESEMMMVAG